MYTYFGDYPSDLSLNMALDMGASLDEIDRVCNPLVRASFASEAAATSAFFSAWVEGGQRLYDAAQADEQAGHLLSASAKYRRACIMTLTGERMLPHADPERHRAYDMVLDSFRRYVETGRVKCEFVQVPYGDSYLPALFVGASSPGPSPAMVHFNGLDGIKEFLYFSGIGNAMADRGVSMLIVDNPGVGEALRKLNLHNSAEAEIPAAACIDYLEGRSDVDPDRIGFIALSLGGFHAVRAPAFEPRIKCSIAWGANFDWGRAMRDRVAGGGNQKSVPHFFEHVMWVLGAETIDEVLKIAEGFTLENVAEKVTVPILIVHGEKDIQVPVEKARMTYEACVNSPARTLRIFTAEEGGEQHCQIGNMNIGVDFMADWASDVLHQTFSTN